MTEVEVGSVYRLNAPWHPRHGRLTLVAHARMGASPEYSGRLIYHIIDTDDFIGEPDWDSEYVPSNFSDAGIDINSVIYWKGCPFIQYVKYENNLLCMIYEFTKNNKCSSSLMKVVHPIFDNLPHGHLIKDQIISLYSRYDGDEFITINPPY